MIKFAGSSFGDSNIHVKRLTDYVIPERDITYISVPGRSGDIVQDNGRYKNFTLDYEVYVLSRTDGVISSLRTFAGKLNDSSGSYERFEDDQDPLVYGMAKFVGPSDWTNQMNIGGETTLKFNFKPYWRYKSGETAVTVASGGAIINSYAFSALPLIKVTGNGAGTLTVGAYIININTLDDYLYIDCEEQNVYRERYENRNSYIDRCKFPQLIAGNNTVTFSGGITGVEITPRWRTL